MLDSDWLDAVDKCSVFLALRFLFYSILLIISSGTCMLVLHITGLKKKQKTCEYGEVFCEEPC